MPQFLRKRRVGLPAVAEIAEELGIERPHLFALLFVRLVVGSYGGGPVTYAQVRAWDPYTTRDVYAEPFAALMERDLIAEDEQGSLSLTSGGMDAAERLHAAGRAFVATHQTLPPEELQTTVVLLDLAVKAVLSDPVLEPRPGSHLAGSRSLATFGHDVSTMVHIEQAIYDLWLARDDAHMKAWRDAGLEGPAMPAFTLVWSGGASTLQELSDYLSFPQERAGMESSLAYLVANEYLEIDGEQVRLTPAGVLVREDIEHETDRIYFASWPHSVEEAERLRDHLQALIEKLPTPAPI